MKSTMETDVSALERIFHEPNRMAILSALCAAPGGLTFTELRDGSGMTDGNLNRHLKALEEANIIRVRKAFVGVKPRTTITLTDKGLKRFEDYLAALSDVLKKAKQALASEHQPVSQALGKKALA